MKSRILGVLSLMAVAALPLQPAVAQEKVLRIAMTASDIQELLS